MKITKKQLATIMQKAKDDDELKQLLQHVFSFPENIGLFGEFFFPKTCTNESPEFHKWIYEEMFRQGNGALAAPRGHAKSSVVGIIFLIYSIVNNLEEYIVYISQSYSKTVQFLDPIRNEFKENKLLRFVYGDLTPKAARDDDGKDREDCFDLKGCRVEAASFEKNIRGFKHRNMRPTLIICDDIEDDQRVLNPDLRVKDSNKLNKIVIPSLDIDGRLKMIGTLLHFDSLLSKKISNWGGKIFKACDEDFNNILWPQRFTEAKLRAIRDPKTGIGLIPFQQEYLNNPIDTTASIIKREWVEKCFDHSLSQEDVNKLAFTNKTMGCDFAFSDRITADRSAFVGLGNNQSKYYLTNCNTYKGLSVNEQMVIIKEQLQPIHNFQQIGLEENSIKAISKDIQQWNLPITLFWTSAADPAARKKPDYDWSEKRHTVGKINLIMRLGSAFEAGLIVIPYKTEADKAIADQILSECTSFALNEGKLVEAGVHPDIPIGLGYALELINQGGVYFDFG